MKAAYIKKHQAQQRALALEHITSLFQQADTIFKTNSALAHRYVSMAYRIALRNKIHLPSSFKRRFCKHCYHYLQVGVNCRVRLTQQKVVYYCRDCCHYMRFPYVSRVKQKALLPISKHKNQHKN